MKLFFIMLLIFLSSTICTGEQLNVAPVDAVSTISGQVMIDSKKPMSKGVVLLFDRNFGPPPSVGRYWRVPDLITQLDREGKFSLEVQPGTYYLQFSQKNPNSEIGPANEKEYFYFHGDSDGNATPLIVENSTKLNLGQLKASIWTPDIEQREKGITAIEGVITDTEGKPIERAVVLAYYNPQGQGRPVFISDRSDKKGNYQLRTNDGGTFFLKVRSVVGGGKPSAGEYLNTTNEFEPVAVNVKKGERLKGVILKVMLFTRPNEDLQPPEKREWKVFEGGVPKEVK